MFTPKIRFIAMSDVHTKENSDCVELERLKRGIAFAKKYADKCEYKAIDAIYFIGDFANGGREQEMLNFKAALEECAGDIPYVISLASHEYMSEGEDAAKEKLKRIFGMHYDDHRVINGFHFISVSSTRGCNYHEPQLEFAKKSLEEARLDNKKAPIFFFQHPHISGTVYGSINWGEDALYSLLMNYPQVIDFSGHSHAPINDPRSVHQKHFTCFGTGSLSYCELDEFDKYYGTLPPDKEQFAQFLIVEADENNRVRVLPVDIISESFFDHERLIETPCEPESFKYTDDRYTNAVKPYFAANSEITIDKKDDGVTISFPQAECESERVNSYTLTVRDEDKSIVRVMSCWSGYYLKNMPKRITFPVKDLEKGSYFGEIIAEGFWHNKSENSLKFTFDV